jgi:hypothetical protein
MPVNVDLLYNMDVIHHLITRPLTLSPLSPFTYPLRQQNDIRDLQISCSCSQNPNTR